MSFKRSKPNLSRDQISSIKDRLAGISGDAQHITVDFVDALTDLSSDGAGLLQENLAPTPTDVPNWTTWDDLFEYFKIQMVYLRLIPLRANTNGVFAVRATPDNGMANPASLSELLQEQARPVQYDKLGSELTIPIKMIFQDQKDYQEAKATPDFVNFGKIGIQGENFPASTTIFKAYMHYRITFKGLRG